MTVELSPFEGNEVVAAKIEIPGAAGGLRDAMRTDPVELHQGDRVYVLLETDVAKVRFEPVDKENPAGPQARVHVLDVLVGTIVDEGLAGDAITAQRERILEAKEAEAGIQRIPFEELDASEVVPAEFEGVDRWIVEARLRALSKSKLRALCEHLGVDVPKSTTGAVLVDVLLATAGVVAAISDDGWAEAEESL